MRKPKILQWVALMLVGAMLLAFASCKKGGGDDEATTTTEVEDTNEDVFAEITTEPPRPWQLEIRGVAGATSFSSEDAQYLPPVEIEMTTTNSAGFTITNKYRGITLRSLLSYVGVANSSIVVVTSLDGTFAEYPAAIAMAEDTLLAWEMDGAPIEGEPPLRMCPKSGTPEMHIKMVSSITVSPAPETTEPTTFSDPYGVYYPPSINVANTYPQYTVATQRATQAPVTVPPTNATQPTWTTEPTTTVTTTTTNTTRTTSPPYNYTQPYREPTTARTTTEKTTRPPATDPPPPTKPDWWGNDPW